MAEYVAGESLKGSPNIHAKLAVCREAVERSPKRYLDFERDSVAKALRAADWFNNVSLRRRIERLYNAIQTNKRSEK